MGGHCRDEGRAPGEWVRGWLMARRRCALCHLEEEGREEKKKPTYQMSARVFRSVHLLSISSIQKIIIIIDIVSSSEYSHLDNVQQQRLF